MKTFSSLASCSVSRMVPCLQDTFRVRLRKYFEEDPQNPVYFRSLRSVGYLFDHP